MSISLADINITSQHLEGGRFACSVDSKKTKALTGRYTNTEVIHCRHATFLSWRPIHLKVRESLRLLLLRWPSWGSTTYFDKSHNLINLQSVLLNKEPKKACTWNRLVKRSHLKLKLKYNRTFLWQTPLKSFLKDKLSQVSTYMLSFHFIRFHTKFCEEEAIKCSSYCVLRCSTINLWPNINLQKANISEN